MPNSATETITNQIIRCSKTIVLARHGKAVKINPDDPDEKRCLNELGFKQAVKLGDKLDKMGYEFDAVLSSPLSRARMTIAIATCGRHIVHDVPELTCSTTPGSPIDVMWTDLGNVPLTNYLEHRLASELKSWSEVALKKMLEKLGSITHNRGNNTVLVGGHALLQPALAYQITNILKTNGLDTILAENMFLNKILGEGEAFVLTIDRLCGKNQVLAWHLCPA